MTGKNDYQNLDLRDQSLLNGLKVSKTIAPLVIAVIIGVTGYNYLDSVLLGGLIGLTVGFFVYQHHKGLPYSINRQTGISILLFSTFVSGPMAINVEVLHNKEFYRTEMLTANQLKLQDGVVEFQYEIDKLYARRDELSDRIQQAAEEVPLNIQKLADARRAMAKFETDFEDRLSRLNTIAAVSQGYIEEIDDSDFAVLKYYISELANGNVSNQIMTFIYFLLIFLIEGSPGLFVLLLVNSEYASLVAADKDIRKMLQSKLIAIKKALFSDESNLKVNLFKYDVIDSLFSFFNSGMSANEKDEVLAKFHALQMIENGPSSFNSWNNESSNTSNSVIDLQDEDTPTVSDNGVQGPPPQEDEIPLFDFNDD